MLPPNAFPSDIITHFRAQSIGISEEPRHSTRFGDAINNFLKHRKTKELFNEKFEGRAVLASTSEDYVSACSCFSCRSLILFTHLIRREVQYEDRMVIQRDMCVIIVFLLYVLTQRTYILLAGWSRLNEILVIAFLHQFLPGRLSQNVPMWNTFQDYCEKPNFFSEFMSDLLIMCEDTRFGWEPQKIGYAERVSSFSWITAYLRGSWRG